MKFLIVIHYFKPHIGGMEMVAFKQAQSLIDMGHDVTILTCRLNQQTLLKENIGKIKVIRLRSINYMDNKLGITFPLISPLNIFRLLREVNKYDIVHIHDVFYMTSHIAGIASILRKKRFFITQHVAIVDHPNPIVILIQKIVFKTFGLFLFHNSSKIVAYNVNVKDFLENIGVKKDKILLNYNGVDVKKFSAISNTEKNILRLQYNLPTDKKIVLFVGRLVPKKGFDIVFGSKSSSYLVLIVGPGTVPDNMKNSKDVVFFGSADDKQVCDLYRLSDIFAFPATGEIFTLAIQEAMACCLPIITTNDSGYNRYDLDHTKMLFINKNSNEYKKSINSLINNPNLMRSMGEYSRQITLERFSWQKNYGKEYSIYKDIVKAIIRSGLKNNKASSK